MKKQIHLSDHFSYGKLLRFTLPSIVMMIFTSVYSVVDGLFVSNFVGKTAFAAINLIMPVLNILGTFGYMFGAGGSALIAKTLGEQEQEKANRLFSLFVYLSIGFGVLMMLLGIFFMQSLRSTNDRRETTRRPRLGIKRRDEAPGPLSAGLRQISGARNPAAAIGRWQLCRFAGLLRLRI